MTASIQPGSLDGASLTSPAHHFRGELLTPGQVGYEEARRLWNGHIDRRPPLWPGAPDPALWSPLCDEPESAAFPSPSEGESAPSRATARPNTDPADLSPMTRA